MNFKPRRTAPQEQAIHRLLRPVVRFALRRDLRIQDFFDIVKGVFVEVAENELSGTNQKINTSRLSIATGLTRKDVSIFFREDIPAVEAQSVLTRILGQWEHDRQFSYRNGKPKILDLEQFGKLVRKVSQHVGPKAVLAELERNGAVEYTPRGVKLLRVVADFTLDELRAFDLIARDITDLVSTLEHNLHSEVDSQNAHFRTEYTSIASDAVPDTRRHILNMTRQFHASVREYLSKFDLDINPTLHSSTKKLVRIMLSSFSFIEDSSEEKEREKRL